MTAFQRRGRPSGLRRLAMLVMTLFLPVSAAVALTGSAAAHPLGNFTVNRYARVEVGAGHVRVRIESRLTGRQAQTLRFRRQRDSDAIEGDVEV